MIVQCGSCKTRFKIADEKISDRGVKVRCSKCGTVFTVRKGDGDEPLPKDALSPKAPAPAVLPPPPDPFSDDEFSSTRVQEVPAELLGALARGRTGLATPAPALPPQPAARHVFGPPGADLSAPDPFHDAVDPFQSTTAPGVVPAGEGAPLERDPFAADPFGSLAGDVAAGAPPEGPSADPFAGLDLGLSSAGAAPVSIGASPARVEAIHEPSVDPFAGLDLGTAGGRRAAPGSDPTATPGPKAKDAYADVDFGDAAPPPPPRATSTVAPAAGASAAVASADPFGDDDPFAGLPAASKPAAPTALPAMSGGAYGGTFGEHDDPDLGPAIDLKTGREKPAAPVEAAPAAAEPLVAVPAAPAPRPAAPPPTAAAKAPEKPRASTASTVLNALSGFALVLVGLVAFVAWRNEGRLDLRDLSVDVVLRAFGLDLSRAEGATRELVAVELSNGLYPRAAGKPAFFVRGKIQNRAAAALGPAVRVEVELLKGARPVASASGWVAATPSAEEVHRLADAAAWDVLATSLGAAKGGPLEAGQSAPFLVIFAEPPPALEELEIRVRASAAERPVAPPPPPRLIEAPPAPPTAPKGGAKLPGRPLPPARPIGAVPAPAAPG